MDITKSPAYQRARHETRHFRAVQSMLMIGAAVLLLLYGLYLLVPAIVSLLSEIAGFILAPVAPAIYFEIITALAPYDGALRMATAISAFWVLIYCNGRIHFFREMAGAYSRRLPERNEGELARVVEREIGRSIRITANGMGILTLIAAAASLHILHAGFPILFFVPAVILPLTFGILCYVAFRFKWLNPDIQCSLGAKLLSTHLKARFAPETQERALLFLKNEETAQLLAQLHKAGLLNLEWAGDQAIIAAEFRRRITSDLCISDEAITTAVRAMASNRLTMPFQSQE